MARASVHLHVGMPKTGTTFVQKTLWANRAPLRSQGVHLAGNTYFTSVAAGRDLLTWRPDLGEPTPDSWSRLAGEASRWRGRTSLISQEFLVQLDEERIARVVAAFSSGVDVRVLVTARDIGRLIPAQWQTAIRGGKTWTLDQYADAVAGQVSGAASRRASEHFWNRQALDAVLDRWSGVVGPENVTLITVPRPGSDPEELWLRFCRACGLEPATLQAAPPAHESLGAASSEVMRRLNSHPMIKQMSRSGYKRIVNHAISRDALQSRRHLEPSLGLPHRHRPWADAECTRMIDAVRQSTVDVVGELDDLRSRFPEADPVVPDRLPPEDLLAAALDAVAALEASRRALPSLRHPRPRTTAAGDASGAAAALTAALDDLAALAEAAAATRSPLEALVHTASERSRTAARLRAFIGAHVARRS